MATEKDKSLGIAIAQIERHYGKGAIMRLGDVSERLSTEVVSTGSLSLDIALGAGGVPQGRITEIYGTEGAGKSTLALHIMAETQKKGGTAAYIDVEHALEPSYSANAVWISKPSSLPNPTAANRRWR